MLIHLSRLADDHDYHLDKTLLVCGTGKLGNLKQPSPGNNISNSRKGNDKKNNGRSLGHDHQSVEK